MDKILLFISAVAAVVFDYDVYTGGIEISMLARPHQGWEYWCVLGLLRVNVQLNFKLKLNTAQLS